MMNYTFNLKIPIIQPLFIYCFFLISRYTHLIILLSKYIYFFNDISKDTDVLRKSEQLLFIVEN